MAVLRRARSDAALLVTAWALLVAAIALVGATLALADAVSLGGLRRSVESAPAADRIVTVSVGAHATEASSLAARVRPALGDTLQPAGGLVSGTVRARGLVLVTSDPGGGQAALPPNGATLLASYDDLPAHATLAAGRWPLAGREPIEAVLPDGAASALGLRVGSRPVVADSLDRSRSIPLVVVGTYQPIATDPAWGGSVLETTGTERSGEITSRGPFVVAAPDLVAVAPRDVELAWRLVPDVTAMRTDDVPALRAGIGSLGDRLGAILPATTRPEIATGLPPILADLERSLLVTRAGVALLALQFGILAGYAIVLVAAVLVERRRDQVRMLRARGASALHVLAMALVEACLLVVPAAIVAPVVAVGAVDALGSAGSAALTAAPASIDARMLLATAAAAVASVAALVLPTLASTVSRDGLRVVRPSTTTLPQRLGLDLALLALAALGLWQLGTYGGPLSRSVGGSLGVDPLLVAAPAIGLLAGAVLAVRAVPRLAELLERLVARRTGAVAAVGGRQLARRPLRYSRAALLLVLAVAFGTYALADASTWLASQADQAAYQAVGGIRVVPSSGGPTGSDAAASYRAAPGVVNALPAVRDSVSTGTLRDGQLLAVDVAGAAGTGADGWTAAGPLASLTRGPAASRALELPAGVRRLAVTVDAALSVAVRAGDALLPLDAATRAISVAAVVVADGLVQRVEGSDAAIGGGSQRVEVALPPAPSSGRGAAPPTTLEAIEIVLDLPLGAEAVSGSVDLSSIEASAAASGEEGWTRIDGPVTAPSWGWRVEGAGGSSDYTAPPGQPRRIRFPLADPGSGQAGDLSAGEPVTVTLLALPVTPAPLPALASPAFLAATGTRAGDVLAVTAGATQLQLRIEGEIGRLAPLDPAAPSVVVDGPTLGLARFADTGDMLEPTEWWLAVEPGREAAALAAIRASSPPGTTVVGREELAGRLRNDPVAIGIIGALGLGALAAAVFAVVGFLVSGAASAAERVGEYALLEALGLSTRQLYMSLALEGAFLLVVGIGGGLVLGLSLAWAVLPFATLTASGARPVPPPAVVVPWPAALPLFAIAAILLALAVAVAIRQLGRRSVAAVLRTWEA